jgi:hypothetical protein
LFQRSTATIRPSRRFAQERAGQDKLPAGQVRPRLQRRALDFTLGQRAQSLD